MATMTEERAGERTGEHPGNGVLLYGFLAGALAWKLQLMVNYSLVPFACWQDLGIVIHLASLVTLLLALSGVWLSLGSWRKTGEGFEMEKGPLGRARFLAVSGIVLSAYFAFLILGQWIPNLLLSPCDGIS